MGISKNFHNLGCCVNGLFKRVHCPNFRLCSHLPLIVVVFKGDF